MTTNSTPSSVRTPTSLSPHVPSPPRPLSARDRAISDAVGPLFRFERLDSASPTPAPTTPPASDAAAPTLVIRALSSLAYQHTQIEWHGKKFNIKYKPDHELNAEELTNFKTFCTAHLDAAHQAKPESEIFKKPFVLQKGTDASYDIIPYEAPSADNADWAAAKDEDRIHVDKSPEKYGDIAVTDCFHLCKEGFRFEEIQHFCKEWAINSVKTAAKSFKPSSSYDLGHARPMPTEPSSSESLRRAPHPSSISGGFHAHREALAPAPTQKPVAEIPTSTHKIKDLKGQDFLNELAKMAESSEVVFDTHSNFIDWLREGNICINEDGTWNEEQIRRKFGVDIYRGCKIDLNGKPIENHISYDELKKALLQTLDKETDLPQVKLVKLNKCLSALGLLNQAIAHASMDILGRALISGVIDYNLSFSQTGGKPPLRFYIDTTDNKELVVRYELYQTFNNRVDGVSNPEYKPISYSFRISGIIEDNKPAVLSWQILQGEAPKDQKPLGIANGGNNCWLNSMLQAIRVVPHLNDWVRNWGPESTAPFRQFYQTYDRDAIAHKTITGLKVKDKDIITSQHLRAPLGMPLDGQQDAHEGLMKLLSEVPDYLKGRERTTRTLNDPNPEVHDEIVVQNHPSAFSSLEFEPNKDETSIQGMIDAELNSTKDNSTMKFHDKEYSISKAQRVILDPPPVLTVGIKRFKKETLPLTRINRLLRRGPGVVITKNEDNIQGAEIITLPADADGNTHKYRLRSFITHEGNAPNVGHYKAYGIENGKRYCYDDRSVTEKTQNEWETEQSQAYVLLYELVAEAPT